MKHPGDHLKKVHGVQENKNSRTKHLKTSQSTIEFSLARAEEQRKRKEEEATAKKIEKDKE